PWLQSWQRQSAFSRRTLRPCIQRTGPLALERLEERLVPSTNQDYVQQAFLDVLHRPVDAPSLARLAGALDAGVVSRTDVSGFIATAPEARVVQTQDLFTRYLHRSAEPMALSALSNFL